MEKIFVDVTIPIRTYLKRFIESNKDVDPFFISLTNCPISALIMEPLQKDHVKPGKDDFKFLNDSLVCRMSSTVMREKKFWMTDGAIVSIDKRLKALFNQQLIDFITMNNEKKGDIYKSIDLFMEFYNISELDLSRESLFKMYYRSRTGNLPEKKKEKIRKITYIQLSLAI